MSKQSIKWHEDCLKNSQASWAADQKRTSAEVERLEKWRIENQLYEDQIQEAKRKGRDGFDREKFGKKRGER